MVSSRKDVDAHSKLSAELLVEFLHKHQRKIFVMHALNDGMLQRMTERSVPDVMQEYRGLGCTTFLVGDFLSTGTQRLNG